MRSASDTNTRSIRVLAVTALVAAMLAVPGIGTGEASVEEDPSLAHQQTPSSAGPGTVVLTSTASVVGQPDTFGVELTISSGPEGATLPMQVAFDGPINESFTFVIFTAGKGEDFRDGGQEPTATGGADYFHTRRTFSHDGIPVHGVSVPTYEDAEIEGDEWFLVIASSVSPNVYFDVRGRAWIGDTTASGSSLSVDDVTVFEGDSGTSPATFTVTLDPPSPETVTVEYTTCGVGCHDDATAEKGQDYVAQVGTLRFEPGETTKTVTVSVIGDTVVEEDESFYFAIGNPEGADVSDSLGLGTILNDDTPPSSVLSVNDVTVTEGDAGTTTADFSITLQPAATSPVEVEYSTCGHSCNPAATAQAGEDYESTRTTVTFSPGQTVKTIPVTIFGDTRVEDDETFYFGLLDAKNATIGHSPGIGTILNDDSAALSSLSVGDATVTEGDIGTTTANFTVTLTPAATANVTVEYGTCGAGCDPAATANVGEDYDLADGTLTFTAGQTSKSVAVTVFGDTDVEPDETFFLKLYNPVGATRTDGAGLGTILNDDSAIASSLSVNDVTVTEGDDGTTTAAFTVSLSPAASSQVSVGFATCGSACAGATATAGVDFTSRSGTVTFAPGITSKTIAVAVLGDTHIEPDETFFLNLQGPIGATISDGQGRATILNDDTGGGNAPLCAGSLATIWGNGLLVGTEGNDIIAGGPGPDEIRGNGGNDIICGFEGDDMLIGGLGDDRIWGGSGADLIKGLPGDDMLYGGPGDDRLQGNAGIDIMQGDDGKDRMWGGIGPDLMTGGAGNDQIHGNPGGDGLSGGTGTDRIWGDADNDSILGGDQSDFLYGGIGDDTIEGEAGNDRIFGWHGNDMLFGNEGRDQLRGQKGDDLVDGGPDHDWCSVEITMVSCETPL